VRYLGGKQRQAVDVVDAILYDLGAQPDYVLEPFCGGCSVTVEFAKRGIEVDASDAHPALIALWQAVAAGWKGPTSVTQAEFDAARELPDSDPLKAFIGFGCSFAGVYFASFADKGEGRSSAMAAKRSLARKMKTMRPFVDFSTRSFFDIVPSRSLRGVPIYCDPPYANTEKYRGMEPFDSLKFWRHARALAKQGAVVYVSEYTAPDWATVIYEMPRKVMSRPTKVGDKRDGHGAVECLFAVGGSR
jgi:DNA adenine methylase